MRKETRHEGWSKRTVEDVTATHAAFERLSATPDASIDVADIDNYAARLVATHQQQAEEEWWRSELSTEEQLQLAGVVMRRNQSVDSKVIVAEADVMAALRMACVDYQGDEENDESLSELVDEFIRQTKQLRDVPAEEIVAVDNDQEAFVIDDALDVDGEVHEMHRQKSIGHTGLTLSDMPSEMYAHPLLDRNEEVELFASMDNGDVEAWDEMVLSNTKLVRSIASRYQRKAWALGQSLDLEDLCQEGMFGLMTAIEKYDSSRGLKFSTYATWWIRQSITRAIDNEGSTVRLPVALRAKQTAVAMAIRDIVASDLQPTAERVAQAADISLSEAKALLTYELQTKPTSLNNPVGDENEELQDFVSIPSKTPDPEGAAILAQVRKELADMTALLPERTWYILQQRFWEERTLDDIGDELGISSERVRQLQKKGIAMLRANSSLEYLHDLCDDLDFTLHESVGELPKARPRKLYAHSSRSVVPASNAASRRKTQSVTTIEQPTSAKDAVITDIRSIAKKHGKEPNYTTLYNEGFDIDRIFDAGFENINEAVRAACET